LCRLGSIIALGMETALTPKLGHGLLGHVDFVSKCSLYCL
jgi:hypothetical protein